MLVLRFGLMHENGCDELATTQDWIPLREFSEQALADLDLRQCPACLDQPVPDVFSAAEETAVTAPLE